VSAACGGAFGMAFDQDGNLYVSDQPTGNIYKIPPGGGVVGEGTLLTKTPLGPGVIGLVIDKDGNLYAGRNATTEALGTGVILEIDPSTGDVIRTVASGLTCPALFAQDPVSGDLFADDNCFGGGLNNSSLWRISYPTSAAPSVSVYATLPGSPNGTIAFAPDGTMYITTTVGGQIELVEVSGTSEPSPPTVSVVPLSVGGLGLLANGMQADGAAQYLIGNFPAVNGYISGGVGIFDLTTTPPTMSNTLLTDNSAVVGMIQGPDGCLYGSQGDAVIKITDDSGKCQYALQQSNLLRLAFHPRSFR
jgi:sugar lactone lactonase YvrE